jgi:hypothetical protein
MGRFDYTADDDTHQEIERVGRKLLSPLKGKDNLLKLLKVRLVAATARRLLGGWSTCDR